MRSYFLFLTLSISLLLSAQSQQGKLSIYTDEHKGRTLASGDKYSNVKDWAAHEQLPINSVIKLKNLDNGSSIELSIKDRGPFKIGHIVQVPSEVAQQIGVKEGDLVELELVRTSPEQIDIDYQSLVSSFDRTYTANNEVIQQSTKDQDNGKITWQLASFSNKVNAERFVKDHERNFRQELFIVNPSESLYKVCVGRFQDREEANIAKSKFKDEYKSAFIYRLP